MRDQGIVGELSAVYSIRPRNLMVLPLFLYNIINTTNTIIPIRREALPSRRRISPRRNRTVLLLHIIFFIVIVIIITALV